ncbi:MAG: isochorismatase family protein [Bacteroidetes bacterium]|nr:isochorismatase family protein [Bacteroidota bacterium]
MKRIGVLISIFCLIYISCFSQKKEPLEDKLLIVLDIQEYYANNKLSEGSAQKLIDSVNYVISKTNPNNVIYIKSIHKLLNLSLSYPFVFVTHDSAAMVFDKRLKIVNNQIFTKEESNTFTSKGLNVFLKEKNAKEIIIIGLMAEQCVYKSLIAGKNLGYDMYAIPGAIIGETPKSKDKVMRELINEGIRIIDINILSNQ